MCIHLLVIPTPYANLIYIRLLKLNTNDNERKIKKLSELSNLG